MCDGCVNRVTSGNARPESGVTLCDDVSRTGTQRGTTDPAARERIGRR
jgi:hypothetical protein